jgi:hypothetical protein
MEWRSSRREKGLRQLSERRNSTPQAHRYFFNPAGEPE